MAPAAAGGPHGVIARATRVLLGRLWLVGTWLAARRRARARPEDVQRHVYRDQTRGMGLHLTEWLRDRLRPAWLRVRQDEDEAGE